MKLIGTIHRDFEGPRRLQYVLERLQPQRMTVEAPSNFSPADARNFFLQYRANRLPVVQSTDMPQTLREFYTELCWVGGYEALVPIAYAENAGREVFMVDSPRPGLLDFDEKGFRKELEDEIAKFAHWNEMSYDTVRSRYDALIDTSYHTPLVLLGGLIPAVRYAMAQRSRAALDRLRTSITGGRWKRKETVMEVEREQYMADEIRRVNPDVHIGGLAHVFGVLDSPVARLYSLLGDLVDERIRLCDVFERYPVAR
ncbi:MAG: hypothetical protein HYY37_00120 [Candidatus Aenigmarchaeota archaeon]|nr:hypothetical protein [Candidatus Aenigmarchaeota archaeon]